LRPIPSIILRSLVLVVMALPLSQAGCPADDDNDDDLTGAIQLTDAHQFQFDGSIDAPTIETASATDIQVCWDQSTEDIRCHAMDPNTDVDNLGLIRFGHLTELEIEDAMARDDLKQADIDGYVEWRNDAEITCTNLSEFSFFGTEIDIVEEYTHDGGTYLLTLNRGTLPGVGVLVLGFLAPSESSSVTAIELSSGCGTLDFTVDLQSLTRRQLLVDGPWDLHWDELTRDGQGNDIVFSNVDGIMLGYYEGLSLADLETQFLDLEQITTEMYTIEHQGGKEANLADAVDASGVAFSGFTGDGIWVLALRCSTCYNPAPIFLTVIEPVTQED
jgi:hypothetical protein